MGLEAGVCVNMAGNSYAAHFSERKSVKQRDKSRQLFNFKQRF